MIDIKQIREDPARFKKAAIDKNIEVDIDRLLEADTLLKNQKQQLQDNSTEKNQIGKSIPELNGAEKAAKLNRLSELKQIETGINANIKTLQPEFDELMLLVAQPADDDVPIGKDDTENVEIKRWGKVREFDFEPKDHIELGQTLDIIDVERGVKLAGTRNYFLKGDGALLHWSVLRFSMDFVAAKRYIPLSVPLLMRDEAMQGTAYFPGGEEQTYRMQKDQLNLALQDAKRPVEPCRNRRSAVDCLSFG